MTERKIKNKEMTGVCYDINFVFIFLKTLCSVMLIDRPVILIRFNISPLTAKCIVQKASVSLTRGQVAKINALCKD